MRTEDLIQELVSDAPAGDAPSAGREAAARLGRPRGGLVRVVLFLMGVRRELGDSGDRADFAFEAALLIITAMSAAIGALVISVPGAERSPLVRWAPIVAATASVLWAAGELVYAAATGAPTGRLTFAWHCVYKTSASAPFRASRSS